MKRIKLILVCGLVLALTGLATLVVAAGAQRDTKAIVRSVVGTVTYQADGAGPFLPLKANMELSSKTVLKSGPGAYAYLQVNGFTSTIKLMENTTVTLAVMEAMGAGDTSTDLKLDGGQLLGQVKKLSANSEYRVVVPCGVAGVRGTDFQVTVTFQGNGNYTVVFTSVTGQIVCQVNVPANFSGQGKETLNTGESWTVTASGTSVLTVNQPQTLPADALTAIQTAFASFPTTTPPTGNPPPPSAPPVTTPTTSGSQTGGTDNQSPPTTD